MSTDQISTLEYFIRQEEIYPPHNGKNKYGPSPRTCSIIVASNEQFLRNGCYTKNSWIKIPIGPIDPTYHNTIDINSVWSQAYALSQNPEFDSEYHPIKAPMLTPEEAAFQDLFN